MIRMAAISILVALASTALGQQLQVRTTAPPHFVGEPIAIELQVTGFDRNPDPEPQIQTVPAGLHAQLAGINPSVSRSIQIFNGRRYESTTVVFNVTYQVRADRPGQYTLGPFLVKQNGKQARAEPITLSFARIEQDPNIRVRLVLPSQPVFLGQRVPISVELWLAGEPTVRSLNIYSPIFDQFSFVDEAQDRGAVLLPIQTAKGTLQLPATRRVERQDGRAFTVFSAKRTLVPDQAGQFEFPPIVASLRRAAGRARSRDLFDDFFSDPFGTRRQRTIPSRAVGRPARLVVKPLPAEGRPESFAGAVGPGYTIQVEANRTVVRVGDPITLVVTVRGRGNLKDAGLPPLSADGGMDPHQFRLPEGDVAGVLQDNQKRFSVTVRVNDPGVSEIPALAYSWFDPEQQSYRTARSKPIALRVTKADVISADDVVLNSDLKHPPAEPDGEGRQGSAAERGQQGGSARPAVSQNGFTLSGADLAIETDADRLLLDADRRFGGKAVRAALYVAGMLLVALAVWDRKRRDIAPEVLQRRKTLRRLRAQIERAGERPSREAADHIASALRGMLAEVPDVSRDRIQSVLAQCETMIYAPGDTGNGSLDPALVQRAASVADEIITASRSEAGP